MNGKRKYNSAKEVNDKLKDFYEEANPTVAGLIKALEFKNKKSLFDWLNKEIGDEVGDAIKDAYIHTIASVEKKLVSGKANAAVIFYAKNLRSLGFEYRDDWSEGEDPIALNRKNKVKIEICDKSSED